MVAWFNTKPEAEDQRLSFVNDLNREALCARFVIDEDGDFAMEGYITGEHDRARFSQFIEIWHRDWQVVCRHPDVADVIA